MATQQVSSPPLPGRRQGRVQETSLMKDADQGQSGEGLAKFLGLFSLGLGAAEILTPSTVTRAAGMQPHPVLAPTYGLREVAAGVGLLSQRKPLAWVLARIAGDVCDLASLAAAVPSNRTDHRRLAIATAAVAGVTLLDVVCAQQLLSRRKLSRQPASSGLFVHRTMTINRAPEDLYQYWKNLSNLANFMYYVQLVEMRENGRSHWVVKGPAGLPVSWDAETVEDVENRLLRWRSVPGSLVDTTGSVEFAPLPHDRGTEVRVRLTYNPPGGQMADAIAWLFGRSAEQEIREDLRRFKRVVETGEAPTTKGQPRGKC